MTNHVGLCNRLDSLCLSFAIREAHGHQICLDWPESDALRVDSTFVERFWWPDRIGSIKLRTDPTEIFPTLGRYRRIVQRTWLGPANLLDHHFSTMAQGIRIKNILWEKVRQNFLARGRRPVVGVHIRRGDFQLGDEEVYDATARRHPAVPTWWYEYAMGRISARFPDVQFLLSCTGDPAVFASLKGNFDVFELDCSSPYRSKGTDHQSNVHPVADLFALACCQVIIGTPLSTFTHFAANALGPPSVCLLPPLRTSREHPGLSRVEAWGRRATDWVQLCRDGTGMEGVLEVSRLPEPMEPSLAWAKTWGGT